MVTEFALLVVVTALMRIGFVDTKPCDEQHFYTNIAKGMFSEDDMTPDFTEQIGSSSDNERETKKRIREENSYILKAEKKSSIGPSKTPEIQKSTWTADDTKKTTLSHSDEVDVVDREDHITQYLADQLVNTDSEITSLQASELDDGRGSAELKEDSFFAFLTGQQKAVEAWSEPGEDYLSNDLFPDDQLVDFLAYQD